jgi:hypothetical protein
MAGEPDNEERAVIQAHADQALAATLELRPTIHEAAELADEAVRAMADRGVNEFGAIVSVLGTIHVHLFNCLEHRRRARGDIVSPDEPG